MKLLFPLTEHGVIYFNHIPSFSEKLSFSVDNSGRCSSISVTWLFLLHLRERTSSFPPLYHAYLFIPLASFVQFYQFHCQLLLLIKNAALPFLEWNVAASAGFSAPCMDASTLRAYRSCCDGRSWDRFILCCFDPHFWRKEESATKIRKSQSTLYGHLN